MKNINSQLRNVIFESYNTALFKDNPAGYFYCLNQISENIEALKSKSVNLEVFYAMKANNHPEIMQRVVSNKHITGIEIASLGELEQALKYTSPDKIIFTGPGKTEKELYYAIKNEIKYINIESVVEAQRINKIAKDLNQNKVNVLLRINLDYCIENADEKMSGCSTKMGIDQREIINAIEIIKGLQNINISGVHVFAASGVLDNKLLLESNRYIFDLVKALEENCDIQFECIDLGGGIGIDYTDNCKEFDVLVYLKKLNQMIGEYDYENKKIIMELGTYIVGNAGYYTAEIIDIKNVKNKKHIVLAGGVNHMGLPLEMQRKHPVYLLHRNKERLYNEQPVVENEICDISGPLCMVSDMLCWDEYIDKAEIGDIVVFHQSGAYCYGEGMVNFLSHELPNIIIV